jgi:hypothetical protein
MPKTDRERTMAKIYQLHPVSEVRCRQQMSEIKQAFTAELLDFFLLAQDTSTGLGTNTPRGLKAMHRAHELLLEARHRFALEFD